jgi:chaperonin GroEL (HSP60 family)
LKSYDNKGDAVKAARVHTEKTGESTYIKIERVLDKSSGSDVVAEIKYKASTKEAEGNYVFFGYASC